MNGNFATNTGMKGADMPKIKWLLAIVFLSSGCITYETNYFDGDDEWLIHEPTHYNIENPHYIEGYEGEPPTGTPSLPEGDTHI